DGLQQEERGVSGALGAPHPGLDLARGDAHAHPHARVLEEIGAVGGKLGDGQAVLADALARVAARPAQPDADHRQPEVVCRLDEIPGEDAETTGVDGKVLGEAEFHAEVGDGGGHGDATRKRNRGREATCGYRRGGYTPGRFSRNERIASRPSSVNALD